MATKRWIRGDLKHMNIRTIFNAWKIMWDSMIFVRSVSLLSYTIFFRTSCSLQCLYLIWMNFRFSFEKPEKCWKMIFLLESPRKIMFILFPVRFRRWGINIVERKTGKVRNAFRISNLAVMFELQPKKCFSTCLS